MRRQCIKDIQNGRVKDTVHKTYNCIVVFNKKRDAVLFCKRRNDPYKDLYNFVGGKVEPGEESDKAAYRELQEETGITRQHIRLYRLMDIRYYYHLYRLWSAFSFQYTLSADLSANPLSHKPYAS